MASLYPADSGSFWCYEPTNNDQLLIVVTEYKYKINNNYVGPKIGLSVLRGMSVFQHLFSFFCCGTKIYFCGPESYGFVFLFFFFRNGAIIQHYQTASLHLGLAQQ